MAVTNPRIGAAIEVSIGRKGEKPDMIPARITGQAQMVVGANGRLQQVAACVMARTNTAGEQYLAEDIRNLQFAFDRSERVTLLDGTAEHPKTWQELIAERAASAKAYFETLPASGQSLEVADLPV